MEKVLLYIITASGLCAIDSNAERQYYMISDPQNWTQAQSYCREKYTDLVTIENMEDVKTLNDVAAANNWETYFGWIGLYNQTWGWSMSDTNFYKNGEAEFRNWGPGEPNSVSSKEKCGQMRGDGKWNDEPCDLALKAVCSYVRGPNVTFILINNSMPWMKAQSYCRAHYTDLFSVRNMSENQIIQKLIPAGQTVWIGLFTGWVWSDGSTSTFRYWSGTDSNGAKNENCVAVNFRTSGKWEDWTCDFKRRFICYNDSGSKRVVKVRLQINSSLSLNDSTAQDSMLQQLQKKLKDQGVNEDIKLSWRKQSDGEVFHKEEEERTMMKNKNYEL